MSKKETVELNLKNSLKADIRVVQNTQYSRMVYTYTVPILNTNNLIDESGKLLAKGELFSIIWFMDTNGKIHISLYSDKNGADVSVIASSFGSTTGNKNFAEAVFENLSDMLEVVEFKHAN